MNMHTRLNLSFDTSGMPAGVVGARSGSDGRPCRIGQYAFGKLDFFMPPTV